MSSSEGDGPTAERGRAWAFQGNPRYFDVSGAVEALDELTWLVQAHVDEIRVGDSVYLWEAGANRGLVGVAVVISEPAEQASAPREMEFARDTSRFDGIRRRVRLRITDVLSRRLTPADLEGVPGLSGFIPLLGAQGTNFVVSDTEAAALDELIGSERTASENSPMAITLDGERAQRLNLWLALNAEGSTRDLPVGVPQRRQLADGGYLHRGQRGIYRDKARTAGLGGSAAGLTVSVLHIGGRYADDLFQDGVPYHYPTTQVPAMDANEIEATKACKSHGVPLFVIAADAKSAPRSIHLGWVEDWSDDDKQFLITFADAPPTPAAPAASEPFELTQNVGRKTEREVRTGQAHFRFALLKRYGSACAVCDITQREVLDAAHIVPHSDGGPPNPLNGLILCATHHRAHEQGLFGFDPDTTSLRCKDGVTPEGLRLTRTNLRHLPALPWRAALAWKWQADDFE